MCWILLLHNHIWQYLGKQEKSEFLSVVHASDSKGQFANKLDLDDKLKEEVFP